ncbi:hypothetical protein [Paenibacillus sp. YAF4_2]|uniref:hypothetical protein n=1 Tax=Paenibacillus sp. YAF4_2 TaxID=3233085 RepID=UPI003F9A2C3E
MKLKADFESEKNRLNVQSAEIQLQNTNLIYEQERMRVLIREALLEGNERTPIADSSIPSDILSTIMKLHDAMQKNDFKEFQRIDADTVMTSSYEKRDNIKRILWIRHDPDNRAKAIQNEFGLNSEVQLLVVHILMKNSSIIDPNIAKTAAGK